MKSKILLPLGIIILASAITGFMVVHKREPEKNPLPDTRPLVETVTVHKADVQFAVSSQGTVGPRTETTLAPEVAGTVLSVSPKFHAGGFFRQGEILLNLDPADYEVAVDQARAAVATMQARLALEEAQAEQARKDWDMSGRSRTRAPSLALRVPYLEEARANVQSAQADLKKAERKLERTRIRAPYDGLVIAKSADVGQYVGVGAQLGRTIAVDFVEVRLPLSNFDIAFLQLPTPETAAAAINHGALEVELTSVIGGRSYQWRAPIVRTEGVIDERSRLRYAVAQIADPYGLDAEDDVRPPLPVGSFVTARIPGKTVHDVFTIPRNALRADDSVLIKDQDNHLRIRQVVIVRTDDNTIYITEGLNDNDEVIVSNIEVPVDGMAVRTLKDS
ncbi:MAG: efflux RND transporter periplasmic adaptor subunit [Gammaproteobacteria bacterium]|nr:efflux RND transporter periplasmic adaptor subunit [Gammaproteobacteria bacterium]